MANYLFDVTLLAAIRVDAPDEATARAKLQKAIDCNEANLGAWPNGDPIIAEVSIEGDAALAEVDGEAV